MINYQELAFPKPKRKEKSVTRQRTGHTSMMEKCIALAEKITRYKAVCLRCGKDKNIDAHHICKRSYKKTAADLFNIISLCRYECHRFAHDYPDEFQVWIDEKLPGRRIMMEAVNRSKGKPIWDEVYSNLVIEAKKRGVI